MLRRTRFNSIQFNSIQFDFIRFHSIRFHSSPFRSQLGAPPLVGPPGGKVLGFRIALWYRREILAQLLQKDRRPGSGGSIDFLPHDSILAKDGPPAARRVAGEPIHDIPDRLVSNLAVGVEDDRPDLGRANVGGIGRWQKSLCGVLEGARKGPPRPYEIPDPVGLDRIVCAKAKGVGLHVGKGGLQIAVGREGGHQVLLAEGSNDGPPKDKLVGPPIGGGVGSVVQGHGHEFLWGKGEV